MLAGKCSVTLRAASPTAAAWCSRWSGRGACWGRTNRLRNLTLQADQPAAKRGNLIRVRQVGRVGQFSAFQLLPYLLGHLFLDRCADKQSVRDRSELRK